ncbi:MAG: 2-isopropylmalate synthase [Vulcanimicrobiaceae bacterium]
MRAIDIFDTTLRDGEQSPGAAMTPAARLRIARMLAAAGVDTIEAGFPAASPVVARSVAQIATHVRSARVAALARCNARDIDAAGDALARAEAPRIHTFLATSPIHLQHKLRLSQEQALHSVTDGVRHARRRCDDVEFSAEDATRTEPAFLARVFSAAIAAGARTINVPDTVGFATPADMSALIAYLFAHVDGIEDAIVSVHTHDDLGLATANALAAVAAGANQVECTINGIGERAGNCALEEVVVAMRTRPDVFACDVRFDTSSIRSLSHAVARATGMRVQKNKAIVGANAFAHESGIHQDGIIKERSTYEIIDPHSIGRATELPLGRNSGRSALFHRAAQLGLEFDDLSRAQFARAFAAFAEQRRVVRDADLITLAQNVTS